VSAPSGRLDLALQTLGRLVPSDLAKGR
jgi:hypothetical protein